MAHFDSRECFNSKQQLVAGPVVMLPLTVFGIVNPLKVQAVAVVLRSACCRTRGCTSMALSVGDDVVRRWGAAGGGSWRRRSIVNREDKGVVEK